eukprot:10219940-Ditylum_brightwellii.AAC.1
MRETYLCIPHSSDPVEERENIPQSARLIEEFDEWKKSCSSKSTKAKITPLDGGEPRSQVASDNHHLILVRDGDNEEILGVAGMAASSA